MSAEARIGRTRAEAEEGAAQTELTEQRLRHDLRQSLSTVMILAAIVDRQPLDGPVIHGTLDQMLHEVDWMRQVVAGPGDEPVGFVVDVGESVGAIWSSVARARPCTMRFLRESDVWVWAEPVALGRAVRNLLENAVRAAGDGVVEIRVWGDARCVAVEVHDSGPGFGSLKPQQQLGLVTVGRFASTYDGSLSIDTSPLGGALVRLELPRVWPMVDEVDAMVDVAADCATHRSSA